MAFGAAVLVILGLVLIGSTIARESLRRRRLHAFFAYEEAPPPVDVVRAVVGRLPVNRWTGVILVAVVLGASAVAVVADSVMLGVLFAIVALGIPVVLREHRQRQEQLLLRSQMADALMSIASSMSAGSSFVRSLHEISNEARPPLASHLDQVLNEIDVGVAPSDAFRSMAERSGLAPAAWLAHLLRVQESTGSPLVAMLQRLAAHVQQGDGLQREVRALTAEGRMSAYVIAALPVGLVIILELTDPTYLDPFTKGWGIVFSVAMVASICFGLVVVTRMVHSLEA